MNKKLLKAKIIDKYGNVTNFANEIKMPAHYVYEVLNNLNTIKYKPSTLAKIVEPFGYKVEVSIKKVKKPKRKKKKKEQKWTN